MPSSSSKIGAQNARVKKFSRVQNFSCLNSRGLNFRGFYFRVLVVGCENRENLDLVKISHYTVLLLTSQQNHSRLPFRTTRQSMKRKPGFGVIHLHHR